MMRFKFAMRFSSADTNAAGAFLSRGGVLATPTRQRTAAEDAMFSRRTGIGLKQVRDQTYPLAILRSFHVESSPTDNQTDSQTDSSLKAGCRIGRRFPGGCIFYGSFSTLPLDGGEGYRPIRIERAP